MDGKNGADDAVELSGETPGSVEWAVRCWVHSILSQYGAYPPPPGHPRIDKDLHKAEVAWLARAVIERSFLRVCKVNGIAVGFAVLDVDTVYFVYVDKERRRQGHATELVQDVVTQPWFYTTSSGPGAGFVRSLPRVGCFDPFRLYRLFAGEVVPVSAFDAPRLKEASNGAGEAAAP